MIIWNRTRMTILAEHAPVARSLFSRGKGLLGQRTLPPGSGLVLTPCRSMHTLFLAFPLDVLHVARDGTILRILHRLPPWRVGPLVLRSSAVVELPAGVAEHTGTQEGDQLTFEPDELPRPGGEPDRAEKGRSQPHHAGSRTPPASRPGAWVSAPRPKRRPHLEHPWDS